MVHVFSLENIRVSIPAKGINLMTRLPIYSTVALRAFVPITAAGQRRILTSLPKLRLFNRYRT